MSNNSLNSFFMQVDEPIKDVAVKMLCGPFKDASLQSKVNKLKSSVHFF